MKKKFYIETFGCQMNKGDSDIMAFSLEENGFIQTAIIDEADIAIFNTCSVRQRAEDRAVAVINSNRFLIRKKKGIIILAGCMAQRIGKKIIDEKIADIVIGPYQSPVIGKIIKEYFNGNESTTFLSQEREDFEERTCPGKTPQNRDQPWHSWVTITHGCENYCSYCIVPYVRGKLISFKSEKILKFIKELTEQGITEITLLGQNVNQYNIDNDDLPFFRLLEKTAKINGLDRVNYLTSHPKDFSTDIIKVMKDYPNISRAIHLPLQSGSDRVLKLMNRQYDMKHYMGIIEALDTMLDDYSVSTDMIVGFPEETDEDFHQTIKAVQKIRYHDAFMYAYSPREGTPASKLQDNITREKKIERLNNLIKTQRGISKEILESRIEKTEDIIIERISKKSSTKVMGKNFLNYPVVTDGGENDIGKKLKVKISGIKGVTLLGTPVE